MKITRRGFLKLTAIVSGALTIPIGGKLLGAEKGYNPAPIIVLCDPVFHVSYRPEYACYFVVCSMRWGATDTDKAKLDQQYEYCLLAEKQSIESSKKEALSMLQKVITDNYSAYRPIRMKNNNRSIKFNER